MRREVLWAALWLLAGIGLGLASGRPSASPGVAGGAGARPSPSYPASTAPGAALPDSGASRQLTAPLRGASQPLQVPAITRYAGLWYDIAATPDRFHESCTRDATTRYTLRPDASLQIENLCRGAGGDLRDAEGVLRTARRGGAEGRLQLSYAPAWLAWLPLAWSDVQVFESGSGDHLLVMATPDREHLWVLSRVPAMAAAEYQALLARVQAQGFAAGRLRRIPQGGADQWMEDGGMP